MGDSTLQRAANKVVLDELFGFKGPEHQKEAQETADGYIQTKAREDGIFRQVLPPESIDPTELDPQYGFEEPTKLYEIEPDVPAPLVIPFASQTESREPEGNKGLVVFHGLSSVHHRKHKNLLLTYDNDIRQIITDLDLKEILELEDATFLAAVDSALGGAADTNLTVAGSVPLWKTISGGFTPTTFVDCLQIMNDADSRFNPQTVVINQYLAKEMLSWDWHSDEVKTELLDNGWTRGKLFGLNLIVTIKSNLVANNEVYMFCSPNRLGKFYVLDDVTLFPDAKGMMLEWWSEETIGSSLQALGCAKATIS